MDERTSNDNDRATAGEVLRGPDPHGQAAMLLVESLIHGLVGRSVLSVPDAIEIVAIAAEIKEDIAADLGDSPATMRKSLSILGAVETSLRWDAPQK